MFFTQRIPAKCQAKALTPPLLLGENTKQGEKIKDTSVKHIVVIDNTSFHKSAIVKQRMKTWNQQNLFFQFLPPYCSELNRIEILWRRIKQNWLEIMDYDSADTLEKSVVNIIKLYDNKYSITFC